MLGKRPALSGTINNPPSFDRYLGSPQSSKMRLSSADPIFGSYVLSQDTPDFLHGDAIGFQRPTVRL